MKFNNSNELSRETYALKIHMNEPPGPSYNSDLDSVVPEIFWDENRQSASEANPVKVSDDTILPGCLIGLLQVKEETNCQLPLRKRISEISFETHQLVSRATMRPETTLASV